MPHIYTHIFTLVILVYHTYNNYQVLELNAHTDTNNITYMYTYEIYSKRSPTTRKLVSLKDIQTYLCVSYICVSSQIAAYVLKFINYN